MLTFSTKVEHGFDRADCWAAWQSDSSRSMVKGSVFSSQGDHRCYHCGSHFVRSHFSAAGNGGHQFQSVVFVPRLLVVTSLHFHHR